MKTKCNRCGNNLIDGYCKDKTCSFSDHNQSCPCGWAGHPDYSKVIEICTCQKMKKTYEVYGLVIEIEDG